MDPRYQDPDLVLGTLQQEPLALKELTVMDSVIQGLLLCVCVCVYVCACMFCVQIQVLSTVIDLWRNGESSSEGNLQSNKQEKNMYVINNFNDVKF